MSEINAIATNNFILHNIDAKKLYVQEPLFTANSGDAVYVGWRPDETVLYSSAPHVYGGGSSGESFQLSENISAFERIGFYMNKNTNIGNNQNFTEYYVEYRDNHDVTSCNFQYGPVPENNVSGNWFILRASIQNTTCNVSAAYNSYTAVQQPYWGNRWFPGSLYKVVGINRKENA
jgi:hypothetical protein